MVRTRLRLDFCSSLLTSMETARAAAHVSVLLSWKSNYRLHICMTTVRPADCLPLSNLVCVKCLRFPVLTSWAIGTGLSQNWRVLSSTQSFTQQTLLTTIFLRTIGVEQKTPPSTAKALSSKIWTILRAQYPAFTNLTLQSGSYQLLPLIYRPCSGQSRPNTSLVYRARKRSR